MSPTHLEKLETIALAEHVTLSEAVRRLIERAPLPTDEPAEVDACR
jgi:hypothetical protein